MRRHALIAVLALCLGCAKPTYFLAPEAPRADALRTLLVLPLNFEVLPPSNLVDGVEQLQDLVRQHLAATGRGVETLTLRATMTQWAAAVRSVGDANAQRDSERYLAARAELVRNALAASGADAIVLANVEIHRAMIRGNQVAWDGVVRPLTISSVVGGQGRSIAATGSARVTSLHVTVFDRQGTLLFERSRGLEVADELRTEGKGYWVLDREDLFQNDALLRDAVQTVFEPWIRPAG